MSALCTPNYQHCLVNTVSSFLSHYQAAPFHPTLPSLDQSLAKHDPEKIVFLIFDGLGQALLEHHLLASSCLRRHVQEVLCSVFPPTTVAAMTSYHSGLTPAQHGWLGWSLYFKEYGKTIDTFTHTDSYTQRPAGGEHAAYSLMPFVSIYEKIAQSAPEVALHTINPTNVHIPPYGHQSHAVDSLESLFDTVQTLAQAPGRSLIGGYWYEPDHTAHESGPYSLAVKERLEDIDQKVQALAEGLEDTLLIISADHGLTEIDQTIELTEDPALCACLMMPPFIEPRAASFVVLPGCEQTFQERFFALCQDQYKLYSKDEILDAKLFGPGKPHPKFLDFLGNFIAVATGHSLLHYQALNAPKKPDFAGHHAGLRSEEMHIPLIVIPCP